VGSNPTGALIFVCCECRVLSGRGLCDELITRSEESYQLWCVVVCNLETSRMGAPYIYDISSLRVNNCMMVWMNIESMWMIKFMYEWADYVDGRYMKLKCVQLPLKLG